MKVAIVHDSLMEIGGAERVLLCLSQLFPKASIYTSIYRPNKLAKFKSDFEKINVIQSWFGYIPFAEKLISPFRFTFPLIWNSFDFKGYDLIISSSSWAITKGFKKSKNGVEICYCHTPPRYLYGYDRSKKYKGLMAKLVWLYALIVNHFMRIYDFESSKKVDYFIANSNETASRIKKFYRRDSRVIYPPVEFEKGIFSKTTLNSPKGEYFLTGGRLTQSKNFDLIIKTFNNLKKQLIIFGDGQQKEELIKMSGKNITFLGKVDDQTLASLYQNAKAFIVAARDEDFGITPIEANIFGCPVVAYKNAGYLESVINFKTGLFFEDLTVDSLKEAIIKISKSNFDKDTLIKHSLKFSKERFKKEMLQFIHEKVAKF